MTNFATFIDTRNQRAPIAQRGKAKQKRADLEKIRHPCAGTAGIRGHQGGGAAGMVSQPRRQRRRSGYFAA
jgi:hypothetical protein